MHFTWPIAIYLKCSWFNVFMFFLNCYLLDFKFCVAVELNQNEIKPIFKKIFFLCIKHISFIIFFLSLSYLMHWRFYKEKTYPSNHKIPWEPGEENLLVSGLLPASATTSKEIKCYQGTAARSPIPHPLLMKCYLPQTI